MHKSSTVSNSEWIIMELLWVRPYTLMELVSELYASIGWSKSTVATMVRRMAEKGIITYTEKGRTKHFIPTISRQDASMQQTQSLLDRAFHGNVGQMVSTMAQAAPLTAAEINELYQILKKAEEELKCKKSSSHPLF